jgi:hypothetical protein
MMILKRRQFQWTHWTSSIALTLPRSLDWAYAVADKRDLRIDLLRGFAVWVMIVDHFGGTSWLYLITGNNSFFVSGAEAFVFISGLVVGMVYGGIALKQGLRAAQVKAWGRAWTLYKLTVCLTLSFALFSKFFVLPWADDLRIDNPIIWLLQVVILQRTFYLADVILMYTFLMFASCGALWLLAKNRARLLLAVSLTIWLAFQLAPASVALPWHIEGNGTFNLAAWQLLFMVALVIGYRRDAIVQKLARLPRVPYFILASVALIWLVMVYNTHGAFLTTLMPNIDVDAWMRLLFLKSALAPGRLIASLIVFQFAYLTATLFWKPIGASLGWILMPLGQNALYCYTMHVCLISVAHILFYCVPGLSSNGTLNTSLQLLTVVLIWAMIQNKFLFKIVPR